MDKLRKWLKTSDEWIYINDENDEIVSEHTNGEVVFGIIGAFLIIFIIAFLAYFMGK